LDRAGIDQAAVIGADQRAVDVQVEAGIGVGRHDRVEEHEPAAEATVRPRRVAVAVAMGQGHEAVETTQVAVTAQLLGLGRVVVGEGRDAIRPGFEAPTSVHMARQVSRLRNGESQSILATPFSATQSCRAGRGAAIP
jgi:hypothetical protein